MHEVFEIMATIANNLADFAAYHRRLDAQRIERAFVFAAEEERKAKDEALKVAEAERQAKEEALKVAKQALQGQEAALQAKEEAKARADALKRELAELRAKLGKS
jgi:colicin import membrane protein